MKNDSREAVEQLRDKYHPLFVDAPYSLVTIVNIYRNSILVLQASFDRDLISVDDFESEKLAESDAFIEEIERLITSERLSERKRVLEKAIEFAENYIIDRPVGPTPKWTVVNKEMYRKGLEAELAEENK